MGLLTLAIHSGPSSTIQESKPVRRVCEAPADTARKIAGRITRRGVLGVYARRRAPQVLRATARTRGAPPEVCRRSYARRRGAQRDAGTDERLVTSMGGARARLVLGRSRWKTEMAHYRLTFFAAAKKVSAAPHRGESNRPITIQGEANAAGKQPNKGAASKSTKTACKAKRPNQPSSSHLQPS
jgi:hypothetical protein